MANTPSDLLIAWLPIEQAPKDGTVVVLGNSCWCDATLAFWHEEQQRWLDPNDWDIYVEAEPSHFIVVPQLGDMYKYAKHSR